MGEQQALDEDPSLHRGSIGAKLTELFREFVLASFEPFKLKLFASSFITKLALLRKYNIESIGD